VGGLVVLRLGVELVRVLTGAPQIDAPPALPPEQPVEIASASEHEEPGLETPEAAQPEPDEVIEPSRPSERRSDAASRQPSSVDASTLAAELALLEAAHAARDPAAALRELERHRAQVPRGELADERELLRVETLCRLDRQADARALAERFLLDRPGSAMRQRIASACRPAAPQKD
jgi:hypothetical protein